MKRRILVLAIGGAVLVLGIVLYLVRMSQDEPEPPQAGTVSLEVYGPDEEAMRLEVAYLVPVPDTMSLEGKLRLLARKVSEHRFNGLPVEFVEIDASSGRRIAVIDLRENVRTGHSWRTGFFQGSTGGHFTTASLVETFLQRDYRGRWVDGVEFLYEGRPVSRNWDHVRLDRPWFRNEPRPREP